MFAFIVPIHRIFGTSESLEKLRGSTSRTGQQQHHDNPQAKLFFALAFYSSQLTEQPVSHPGIAPGLAAARESPRPAEHGRPAQGKRGERRNPQARGAPARPG